MNEIPFPHTTQLKWLKTTELAIKVALEVCPEASLISVTVYELLLLPKFPENKQHLISGNISRSYQGLPENSPAPKLLLFLSKLIF